MEGKVLTVFTISFPYGNGEHFLHNEILHLSKQFEKIVIFPMNSLNMEMSSVNLPVNVEVVNFNMFQPYNRITTLFSHIGLIIKLYGLEILKSPVRWHYLFQFKKTLNELTHKISVAQKLETYLQLNNQKLEIAYTYWFNQWTFILSLLHKDKPEFNLYTRIHGMDVYEEQHSEKGFFFQFRTFQLTQIKKVLAISLDGKNHLLKSNNISEDKISVLRLGTEDYGLGKIEKLNCIRIVSCSGFQSYKRVHLIIEILSYMKERIEWIHFGDGELEKEILSKSNSLPENITFNYMGFKTNSYIMDYYQSHHVDLFINVSETEGVPVSIMEAISFGIPVIATNVGGVKEIVNNQTGFLTPKHFDTKDVSSQIADYFKLSGDDKQILRNSTRKFWTLNYNASNNYNSLYNEITSV